MIDLIKKILGLILVAGVGFTLGFGYGRRKVRVEPESHVIRDTVSYTIHDTIVRERPVYVASYIYDTIRTHFTTVEHDTVAVEVPMERKVYHEDSLYHAVLSGWRPSLDTLIIWPKTTTVTITRTERIPAPRWSIGATVGPSLIATPKGSLRAGFGVTAGLSYRF